ncbi:hypothetical protein AKJ16_DCAP13297 [Drosera capensis]
MVLYLHEEISRFFLLLINLHVIILLNVMRTPETKTERGRRLRKTISSSSHMSDLAISYQHRTVSDPHVTEGMTHI